MPRALCTGEGSWVPAAPASEGRPVTDPEDSCPRSLSRFSWLGTAAERDRDCCSGPAQRAWLGGHHRTCDGASVSLPAVLDALRDRTLVFFGDSVTGQYYDALVAELFRHNLSVVESRRLDDYGMDASSYLEDDMCSVNHHPLKKPPATMGSALVVRLTPWERPGCRVVASRVGHDLSYAALCRNEWSSQLHVPSTNTTVRWFWFSRNESAEAVVGRLRNPFKHGKNNVTGCASNGAIELRLEAALEGADVLVANIGLYYNEEQPNDRDAYAASLDYVLRRLKARSRPRPSAAAPHGRGPAPLLLFRTASRTPPPSTRT